MAKNPNRRTSRQRELVLAAVCTTNHGTAKELYEKLKDTALVSLATVYRNLMVLQEAGEISAVACEQDPVRYDRRRDPHYHLRCRRCAAVFDMPLAYLPELDLQAAAQSDFTVDSHSITFEGVCAACRAVPAANLPKANK